MSGKFHADAPHKPPPAKKKFRSQAHDHSAYKPLLAKHDQLVDRYRILSKKMRSHGLSTFSTEERYVICSV